MIEVIMDVAQGNYSVQINFNDNSDDYDALAMGINMMIDDIRMGVERAESARDYTNNIIASISDILLVISPDKTIRSVNLAGIKCLEYSEDQLVGKPLSMLFQDEEDIFEGITDPEFFKKYTFQNLERKFITKSGKKLPVLFSASILYEREKNVDAIIGIARDITDLKQAHLEKNRLVSILEATSDLVSIISSNGQAIYMNKAGKSLTGFSVTKNKRKIITEYYPEWAREVIQKEAIPKAIKHGSWKGETAFLTTKGKVVPVSQVIIAHKDSSGAVDFFSTIARDITDQKNLEETLKKKNAELEKLNQELDRFVYSASHDLRAPLTSLLGLINMAKLDFENIINHGYLDMMNSSVKRLDNFVGNIINYSKNSRLDVKKEKINFKAEIEDVIENLKFMKGAERIDFTVIINEENEFYSDKARISIFLNNLISNAIKYQDFNKDDSFIKIEVNVSSIEAVIKVEDNGIGIGEEHHDKLFNMFYRASENSYGSGIGLYIVKETVDKLNGIISFDSKYCKGSTFTLRLPVNS